MKWFPPYIAVPLAVGCLLGAAYLYYLSTQRRGKKKAAPLAGGIVLTLLGLLLPVLGFDVIRALKKKKLKAGDVVKNGTAPAAVIFS